MARTLLDFFMAGVQNFYPVSIPYSCRFDSARNTKFTRTPGVADSTRNIWSLAADLKLCAFSGYQSLLLVYVDANNYEFIQYNGSDGYQFYYGAKVGGVNKGQISFDPKLRDPSQWYSLLFTKSGATVKGYLNGVEMTQTVGTAADSGALFFGGTYQHEIGTYNKPNWYCANHRFLVGTAYTPSSFGQVSTQNPSVWIPKTPTGLAYGTTGWHMDFANASDLGNDVSGNNNDFTSSGFTSADQFTDTPTNNYCTLNPIAQGGGQAYTYSEGNLKCATTTTAIGDAIGTMALPASKTYFEVNASAISNQLWVGIGGLDGASTAGASYRSSDGNKRVNGSDSAYGATWTTGQVIGVACDGINNTVEFFKNNVSQGVISGVSVAGLFPFADDQGSSYTATFTMNFGANGFAYTPPAGFKALCSADIADPLPAIVASGSFTGNANADGYFGYTKGIPETLTINGNAVTWGTHADKLANGFKLRTASTSYNSTGTNTWTATAANAIKFPRNNAQGNP